MSAHSIEHAHPLYGLMAEFETAGELVAAARRTKEAGFRKFDAYTPFPIHELDDAIRAVEQRMEELDSTGRDIRKLPVVHLPFD